MVFFRKPYKVRRYGKTSWDKGYASAPYDDVTLQLDVQGTTRTNQDDPAGRYSTGSLTIYSDEALHPSEPDKQDTGDRIEVMGRWYVCRSSVYWGNTFLKHWVSQFEAVDGEPNGGDENDSVSV